MPEEKKERPMLFNGDMVRAILSGQKTVTRRLVPEWQLPSKTHDDERWISVAQRHQRWGFGVFGETEEECMANYSTEYRTCCPFGAPGDRLWVRESTEAFDSPCGAVTLARYRADKSPVMYLDDDDGEPIHAVAHWSYPRDVRPSIHMTRAQARILLEITAVRAERLQEGEGETAYESRYVAEGINRIHHGDGEYYYHAFQNEPGPGNWVDPFDAWRELWVSVYGAESWNANPWVWVVEFKRVMP